MTSLDGSELGYSSEYLADISALAEELVTAGVTPEALDGYAEVTAEPLDGGADIRSTIEVAIDTTDLRQIVDLQRLIAFAFDTAVVVVHGADGDQDALFAEDRIAGILAEYSVTLELVETSMGSWHGVIEVVARHTDNVLKYLAVAGTVLSIVGAAAPGIGVPLLVVGAVLSGLPTLAAVIPGLDGVRFRGKTIRVPSSTATVKLTSEYLYHYVLECDADTEDGAIRRVRDHLVVDADALGIDRRSFRTTQRNDPRDSSKHFQFTTSSRLTAEQVGIVEGYLHTAGIHFTWLARPDPPPPPHNGWWDLDFDPDYSSPPTAAQPETRERPKPPPAKPANDKQQSAGG